jgi:glucose-1-phosphate cytidylyltransferase
MQVVFLCGGMGTRIRDIAEDIPKPMIPIGEQPILWHIMNCYARRCSATRSTSRPRSR